MHFVLLLLLFALTVGATEGAKWHWEYSPKNDIYGPKFRIGVVLRLHNAEAGSPNCGSDINPMDVVSLMAIRYFFTEYLSNNTSLGVKVVDACDNTVLAIQGVADFLNDTQGSLCHQDLSKDGLNGTYIAVTGTVFSTATIDIASILGSYCIPFVSALATSPLLNNMKLFDGFGRTVPSDFYQVVNGLISIDFEHKNMPSFEKWLFKQTMNTFTGQERKTFEPFLELIALQNDCTFNASNHTSKDVPSCNGTETLHNDTSDGIHKAHFILSALGIIENLIQNVSNKVESNGKNLVDGLINTTVAGFSFFNKTNSGKPVYYLTQFAPDLSSNPSSDRNKTNWRKYNIGLGDDLHNDLADANLKIFTFTDKTKIRKLPKIIIAIFSSLGMVVSLLCCLVIWNFLRDSAALQTSGKAFNFTFSLLTLICFLIPGLLALDHTDQSCTVLRGAASIIWAGIGICLCLHTFQVRQVAQRHNPDILAKQINDHETQDTCPCVSCRYRSHAVFTFAFLVTMGIQIFLVTLWAIKSDPKMNRVIVHECENGGRCVFDSSGIFSHVLIAVPLMFSLGSFGLALATSCLSSKFFRKEARNMTFGSLLQSLSIFMLLLPLMSTSLNMSSLGNSNADVRLLMSMCLSWLFGLGALLSEPGPMAYFLVMHPWQDTENTLDKSELAVRGICIVECHCVPLKQGQKLGIFTRLVEGHWIRQCVRQRFASADDEAPEEPTPPPRNDSNSSFNVALEEALSMNGTRPISIASRPLPPIPTTDDCCRAKYEE